MSSLPERFESVAHLEEFMTAPTRELEADLARLDGDLMVLGVGGKMGPTLARMAKRRQHRIRLSLADALDALEQDTAFLLKGAIEARAKVGLKMNVPEDRLAEVVGFLPAEKSPTVSRLRSGAKRFGPAARS